MGTTTRITIAELPDALKNEGEKARKTLLKGAFAAAQRFKTLIVQRCDELGITDLGTLKNSWRVERIDNGAIVYSDCPYAGIIELGARPHKVSKEGQEGIAQWAIRKLGVDEKEAHSVAFLICRKIALVGQEPKHLVQDALPMATAYYKEEVERIRGAG